MLTSSPKQSKKRRSTRGTPSAGRIRTGGTRPLGEAQSRVFEALLKLSRRTDPTTGQEYDYKPTLREIAHEAGYVALSGAYKQLAIIEACGWIENLGGQRGYRILVRPKGRAA